MASNGDFQGRFMFVVEKLLHSAVCETTILFEDVVGEMKAEIAQLRTENGRLPENQRECSCQNHNRIQNCEGISRTVDTEFQCGKLANLKVISQCMLKEY